MLKLPTIALRKIEKFVLIVVKTLRKKFLAAPNYLKAVPASLTIFTLNEMKFKKTKKIQYLSQGVTPQVVYLKENRY